MNERIQKLAYEAEDYADSIVDQGGDFHPAYTQKLAELIVRECAKFCDEVLKEAEIAIEQCEMTKTSDRLMMLHDGTKNGAQMSKNRMKKHFGVSE